MFRFSSRSWGRRPTRCRRRSCTHRGTGAAGDRLGRSTGPRGRLCPWRPSTCGVCVRVSIQSIQCQRPSLRARGPLKPIQSALTCKRSCGRPRARWWCSSPAPSPATATPPACFLRRTGRCRRPWHTRTSPPSGTRMCWCSRAGPSRAGASEPRCRRRLCIFVGSDRCGGNDLASEGRACMVLKALDLEPHHTNAP